MATFGLYDLEQRSRDESIGLAPPGELKPGFFDGFGRAAGAGVMRGGAKVVQAGAIALSAPFVAYDRYIGENITGIRTADPIYRFTADIVDPAIEYWTPDPADVGAAGRVLGGFSEIALPLAAGGGNPALLAGTMSLSEGADLVKQGAPASGAAAVSFISAASLGLGFKIPMLGGTLAQRLAFGAGSNVALGATQRGASRAVLEATDAPGEIRMKYDPLDAEAAAVETLMGLVFGGLAHVARPDVRDAVLTASNAKHLEVDTAPGRPATDDARTAHTQAMEAATRQVLRGEPVNVADAADRLRFERSPVRDGAASDFAKLVDQVRREETPPDLVGEIRTELGRMAQGAGWVETGGRIIRDPVTGEVTGRTQWIAQEPWFADRPRDARGNYEMNADEIRDAVTKALNGDRLGAREQRTLTYMIDEADGFIRQTDAAAANALADEIDARLDDSPFDDVEITPEDAQAIHRANRADPDAVERAAIEAGDDTAAFMQTVRRIADEAVAEDARRSAAAGRPAGAGRDQQATAGGGEDLRTIDPFELPRDGRPADAEAPPRGSVEDAEARAAEQLIADLPDLEVVGPDGEIRTAAELMRWADDLLDTAKNDARAIEAAVSCFLRS